MSVRFALRFVLAVIRSSTLLGSFHTYILELCRSYLFVCLLLLFFCPVCHRKTLLRHQSLASTPSGYAAVSSLNVFEADEHSADECVYIVLCSSFTPSTSSKSAVSLTTSCLLRHQIPPLYHHCLSAKRPPRANLQRRVFVNHSRPHLPRHRCISPSAVIESYQRHSLFPPRVLVFLP